MPLVERRWERAIVDLGRLVNQDSGSYAAANVNRVADLCEIRLRSGGWKVERLRQQPNGSRPATGDVIIGRRTGGLRVSDGGRRLLLLAHMDTVFDDGTARLNPFRVEGDRALGAGVADDKIGIVAGCEAVEVLCDDLRFDHFAGLTLICSPDEEIGSPFSRGVIARLAAEHDIAIALEVARVDGSVVTARKGIWWLSVEIAGVAAHAGVGLDDGVNAAMEAAHKAIRLHSLNGRWPGVTVNVGKLSAGTRPNVVPSYAVVEIDLRSPSMASFNRVLDDIQEIVTWHAIAGTRSSLRATCYHEPMEQTPEIGALFDEAKRVAAALGMEIGEVTAGGAGDANMAAAAGLPVIDGLAPIGGGTHSMSEWVDLPSVVPRIALLAGLLARLGGPPSN